jgi:hypothetical protein
VISVDYQSAGFIVAFAGVAVALFGYLRTMKQELRAEIAASETRTGERFDAVRAEIVASETRTGERIEVVRAEAAAGEARTGKRFEEVRAEIAASETRTGKRIDDLRAETGKRLDDLRAETRAGFAQVGSRLSVLEARSYDLGRALPPPAEPDAS